MEKRMKPERCVLHNLKLIYEHGWFDKDSNTYKKSYRIWEFEYAFGCPKNYLITKPEYEPLQMNYKEPRIFIKPVEEKNVDEIFPMGFPNEEVCKKIANEHSIKDLRQAELNLEHPDLKEKNPKVYSDARDLIEFTSHDMDIILQYHYREEPILFEIDKHAEEFEKEEFEKMAKESGLKAPSIILYPSKE